MFSGSYMLLRGVMEKQIRGFGHSNQILGAHVAEW